MAAPGGKFFIQDNLSKPAAHHESFAQLWETKWKAPATMGVYPFMFSTAADFQPVVDKLIEGDFKEPYNWDEYAQVYFPQAEHLKSIAEQAEAAGEKEKASEYYLRASAVYRISRFPAPRSQVQREAWRLGKASCIKGLGMREHPVHEIEIPHTHGASNEGSVIPVYHLVPDTATPEAPVPTVVIFTGLDGYRTELAVWMEGWRQVGVATVVLEIPGTGDCPANASDPTSPDRLYSSLFDWMDAQPLLDSTKRAIWAFSTGGFYAIRVAHTHADRLAGVVALVRSVAPRLSARQVMRRITETAHHPAAGWNPWVGHGVVDALAAVTADGATPPRSTSADVDVAATRSAPPPDASARRVALIGGAACVAAATAATTLSVGRLRRRRESVAHD